MSTLRQPVYFFVRRIVFIMALQANIFALKWGALMFSSVGYMAFLFGARPYNEPSIRTLEKFNETFLICGIYMLASFTSWIPDHNINYQFGWIFVYILGPLFLFNISFVVIAAIEEFLLSCKRKKAIKLLK